MWCALTWVAMLSCMALAADPNAPRTLGHAATPPSPSAQQTPAPTMPAVESLVLLKNGAIFVGHVERTDERYRVVSDGVEIRLAARDVDLVCGSLDEAYQLQHKRIAAGRLDDRLRLADWCLRHRLYGYAAVELATAMESDPRHPGILAIDRRGQCSS